MLTASLLLTLPCLSPADEPVPVAVGTTIDASFEEGDPAMSTPNLEANIAAGATRDVVGRRFLLRLTEAGTVTIELRSLLVDPYLVLRDDRGEVLAEDDDGGINLHARVVARLEPDTRYIIEAAALHGMRGPFELSVTTGPPPPLDEEEHRRQGADDHARRIEAVTRELDGGLVSGRRLLQFARLVRGSDDDPDALPYCQRAIQLLGEVEPGGVEVSAALADLGRQQRRMRRYEEAAVSLNAALIGQRQVLGPEHEDTRSTLRDLARCLTQAERHAEARSLWQELVDVQATVDGSSAPSTANAHIDLGLCARALGDGEAAEDSFSRALDGFEQSLGPRHPSTATAHAHLGSLLESVGDFGTARIHFEEALEIREAVLEAGDPATIRVLQSLAALHRKTGNLEEASHTYPRLVEALEAADDLDELAVACALTDQTKTLYQLQRYPESVPWALRSYEATKRVHGAESGDAINALQHLGDCLCAAGRLTESLEVLERLLEIIETVHGTDSGWTATALNSLANARHSALDWQGASDAYERSIAIYLRMEGEESLSAARVSGNLGKTLQSAGRIQEARTALQRSVAVHEAVLGRDAPDTLVALQFLADLLRQSGDLEEAREIYEHIVSVRERDFGPESLGLAIPLHNLALLQWSEEDLANARNNLERAITLVEQSFGPGHSETLRARGNLSGVLFALGEVEKARAILEGVLATQEQVLGPDHPDVADSLQSLAEQLPDEEVDRKIALYRRALAIHQRTSGPESPSTAINLINLGVALHTWANAPQEARPLYEQALAILAGFPEYQFRKAQALTYLASILRTEDVDAGIAMYRRALEICKREVPVGNWLRDRALDRLVWTLLAQGQGEEAIRLLHGEREGRVARLLTMLVDMSEGAMYRYLARGDRFLEHCLAYGAMVDAPAERVLSYESLLSWKGQVARLLSGSRARLAQDLSPEQRVLIARLKVAQRELAAVLKRTSEARPAELTERLRSLAEERDTAEEQLRGTLTEDLIQGATTTFQEVREGLPPGAALVDFTIHFKMLVRRTETGEIVDDHEHTEPHLFAWIVRRDLDAPVRVDLGTVAPIEDACRAHLRSMHQPVPVDLTRGIGVSGSTGAVSQVGALLWEPIAQHLGGIEMILVSPEGFLGGFPLETIATAGGPFLVEQHSFVYLHDPAWLARRSPSRDSELDSLLAIGGVEFGDSTGSSAARTPRDPRSLRGAFTSSWQPLPATESEARAVLRTHEAQLAERGRRLLLTGSEPTESRLRAELPRFRVAHLATHGFFQPEELASPWPALRELDDAGIEALQRQERQLIGKLPGLLSGLVCAHANSPATDGEDGLLTAEEVSWLDLQQVELVVLSACDTGLGRPQSGEGLIGLRRAFHVAGASTVISSLWSVGDAATAELMGRFYDNLFHRGMGRLEAFRTAQLSLLESNRRTRGAPLPDTWGAFVLSGDWR